MSNENNAGVDLDKIKSRRMFTSSFFDGLGREVALAAADRDLLNEKADTLLQVDSLDSERVYEVAILPAEQYNMLIDLARRASAGEARPAGAAPVYQVKIDAAGHWCDIEFRDINNWKSAEFEVRTLYAAHAVSSPAQSAEAEPVAWMNPETLDVIHDTRKRAWENDFGMGGKSKAAGYTYPLAAPAPQEVKQSDKAVAANADGLPTAAWLIEWETATGDKRHMVAMHNFAGDVRAEHGNATATELVRRTAAADAGEPPADPMDWPIPCDVKVGGVTIKEGCKLRTLVTRMESLQRMAVAGLPKVTQEERDAFFKQFPHLAPADRAAAQGAADQDPRTTTKG